MSLELVLGACVHQGRAQGAGLQASRAPNCCPGLRRCPWRGSQSRDSQASLGLGRACRSLGGGLQEQQGVWVGGAACLTPLLPEGARTLLWLRVLQASEGQFHEAGLLPEGEPRGGSTGSWGQPPPGGTDSLGVQSLQEHPLLCSPGYLAPHPPPAPPPGRGVGSVEALPRPAWPQPCLAQAPCPSPRWDVGGALHHTLSDFSLELKHQSRRHLKPREMLPKSRPRAFP